MLDAALFACALNIAPATLNAVVQVESGGNAVALHVNGLVGPQPRASSVAEAAVVARRFIGLGYSVDLGAMQVNSKNLPTLGYSVEQVLDPCTNIRAGGAILTADYAGAARIYGEGQRALQAALSAYNTGDYWRGLGTYVARYYRPGGVPALAGEVRKAVAVSDRRAPSPALSPFTADTQIYVREASNIRIQ